MFSFDGKTRRREEKSFEKKEEMLVEVVGIAIVGVCAVAFGIGVWTDYVDFVEPDSYDSM